MTTQSNSILIIDDNESIHRDFEKIFEAGESNDEFNALDAEMFGEPDVATTELPEFGLRFASQGKDGFDLLKETMAEGKTFGAAFVDMRMPPGWDGVETIENLWKVDPDLQVVICTAYSDHSWADIIARLGRTDKLLVLKKPFDKIEAVQLATSLCEKRRLLNESRLKMENLQEVVGHQEVELKAAHHNAELLIDSISSILVSLDEEGIVSRWNPVAEQQFGIRAQDAIGKEFNGLAIDWSNQSAMASLVCNKSEPEPKQGEVQFIDPSGCTHTLDVRVCPIVTELSSLPRLILATDITHQKNLQSQLDQAQRLESVGQLAAGVAHEINTPMQYIGDNVRYVSKTLDRLTDVLDCLPALVDEGVSDEQLIEIRDSITTSVKAKKVKSSLKQIPEALMDSIEGVEAVSKIVAAMKEFSHPGNEEKSQVCINHVLESTITVARNEWKYVAEVQTELFEELDPIDGLASELNQAFLNIIVNASHAISDRVANNEISKGLIEIKTRNLDGHVEIAIKDNGGGIPAHVRERVFEPFFTTKDVGKGTGQGLAIARSVIVQKHHGSLAFDVEEGVGTTFIIQLPCLATAGDTGQAKPSAMVE